MVANDERREVAAKLRDSIPADLHLGRGNKAWGLLYLTLFGRYMPNQASGRTYKQVAELLADLMEPPVRCLHYMHPCCRSDAGGDPIDRDALLELADECGDASRAYAVDGHELTSMQFANVARRIRGALGGSER